MKKPKGKNPMPIPVEAKRATVEPAPMPAPPIQIPENLQPTRHQVRAARAFFGFTQAEWSDRLGIYLTTLMDFENDKRPTNTGTRERIGLAMLRLGIAFDEAGNMTLPPEPTK